MKGLLLPAAAHFEAAAAAAAVPDGALETEAVPSVGILQSVNLNLGLCVCVERVCQFSLALGRDLYQSIGAL